VSQRPIGEDVCNNGYGIVAHPRTWTCAPLLLGSMHGATLFLAALTYLQDPLSVAHCPVPRLGALPLGPGDNIGLMRLRRMIRIIGSRCGVLR